MPERKVGQPASPEIPKEPKFFAGDVVMRGPEKCRVVRSRREKGKIVYDLISHDGQAQHRGLTQDQITLVELKRPQADIPEATQ